MAVVRVLVVDDQVAFLRAMTSVVQETPGSEVAGEALSGEESLVAAAELLPDLVLMDVNLPGIDGLETTRRLRGSDCPPNVLLLSTCDGDLDEHFVAEPGAIAHVTKSVFFPGGAGGGLVHCGPLTRCPAEADQRIITERLAVSPAPGPRMWCVRLCRSGTWSRRPPRPGHAGRPAEDPRGHCR